MRRLNHMYVLIFFLGLISCTHNNSVLTIEGGQIQGVETTNGVMVYKGIPYAAPPVGQLRWKEPQPVRNWQGIKICDAFGPNAMQGGSILEDGGFSEDCLYLNVWTSASSGNERRPVIVYIHGGGFSLLYS